MKKQNNQFSKLSAGEMKAVKGGVALPLFLFRCTYGGEYAYPCRFTNPEAECGYESNSCTIIDECDPPGTGCVYP